MGEVPISEHPGMILMGLMRRTGMTQKALRGATGIPEQAISEIWNGKKSITPRVALLLESVWPGTPAELWMMWQANHDLDKARARM